MSTQKRVEVHKAVLKPNLASWKVWRLATLLLAAVLVVSWPPAISLAFRTGAKSCALGNAKLQPRAVDECPPWAACSVSQGRTVLQLPATAQARPVLSVLTSFVGGSEVQYLNGYLADVLRQSLLPQAEVLIGTTLQFYQELPMTAKEALFRAMQQHASLVLIIYDADPGLYGMWNDMIQTFARGEYITNANMDDRRSPGAWQLKVQHLGGDPHVGVVSTPVYPTKTASQWPLQEPRPAWFGDKAKNAVLHPADFFDLRSGSIETFNFPHNSPVWRKSIHAAAGFFNETWHPYSDFEFWLRCRSLGIVFHVLHKPTELYLVNPLSLGRRNLGENNSPGQVAQRLHDMYNGSASCNPRRVLLVHEKLQIDALDGGDFRLLNLADTVRKMLCTRPAIAVRLVLPDQKDKVHAYLDSLGYDFIDAGLDLKGLASYLGHRRFDVTIMGLWFYRGDLVPSIPEAANLLPTSLQQRLGSRVVLSDDAHWVRFTERGTGTRVAINLARMVQRETQLLESADKVILVSSADAQAVAWFVGKKSVADRLCVVKHRIPSNLLALPKPQRGLLCFYGSAYPDNVEAVSWFFTRVWPHLGNSSGVEFALRVFGQYEKGWDRHAGSWPGLDFTQPERKCWAGLAPMKVRSGVSTKTLLTLSRGIPVFASEQAVNGLGCESASCPGVLTMDGDESAFASQLLALAADEGKYNTLRQAAAAFHGSYYDTDNAPGCLMKLLEP